MVKPYFVFHQLVIVSNSNGVNSNIKIGTKKRAKILFQTPTE